MTEADVLEVLGLDQRDSPLEKALVARELIYKNSTVSADETLYESNEARYAAVVSREAVHFCGGMATTLALMMQTLEVPARVVQLATGKDLYETHVTVEVLIEDKWVNFDSTFNSAFLCGSRQSELLSVVQLRECRDAGRELIVVPGEVPLPSRILDGSHRHRLVPGSQI